MGSASHVPLGGMVLGSLDLAPGWLCQNCYQHLGLYAQVHLLTVDHTTTALYFGKKKKKRFTQS